MLRKIYYIFGVGVILMYATASWLGWELASSGKNRSFLPIPFIYSGYRGGK